MIAVRCRTVAAAAALLAMAGPWTAMGASYPLPPDGGRLLVAPDRHPVIREGETLLDLARRYDLGLDELKAANPGVDPWVPPAGRRILIPGSRVLPDAPHEGIVVNLPEMRLYYFLPPAPGRPGRVVTYPLSIGSEGRTLPVGRTTVIARIDHPSWVVPASIQAEHRADGRPVPPVVPPGPGNPLGDYALRLGWWTYLIHGTNEPYSIGMRVSHGCLRLYPEDIAQLYDQVSVGTPVRVVDQPYKAARYKGQVFLEAHQPLSDSARSPPSDLTGAVRAVLAAAAGGALTKRGWSRLERAALGRRGVPTPLLPPTNEARRGDGGRSWFVQIGAYREAAGRQRAGEEAQGMKWEPLTGAAPGDGLCRVYAGPFAGREEASAQRRRLQAATGIRGAVFPQGHYAGYVPCD